MKLQRALSLLLPLSLTTACIGSSDSPDVTETESSLSAFDWSGTSYVGHAFYGSQVASLNGTVYMVSTGQNDKNMYWRKRTGRYAWTAPTLIPGQKTKGQASLAAFNGYLYMVHIGESDNHAVWFSRFNPTTETWTSNAKLPMSTDTGSPALAAFDGRLWMVGATETDIGNQLWVSAMSPSEVFTPQTTLRGKYTSTRVSLAAFGNKLFMAYGSGDSIMTMTHAAGATATTWSAASAVKAGPSGTTSQGSDAKIAVAGGYLHLVHRRPGGSATWWTYWNGCSWAPEIQFDTVTSDRALSLSDGGTGLVLVRDEYWILKDSGESFWIKATEYTAPPAPITLPQCGGVVGT